MRELTYFIATTLDGWIAREDGGLDCFPASGAHLAHIVAEYPETIPRHLWAALGVEGDARHFDCVLMGRHTFEVGSRMGITSPYPHLRQYLFSRTLTESPSDDVHLVRHDARDTVEQLKRQPGRGIWLCGGGRLAAALWPLVDHLVLKINPVVLGAGRPLVHGRDRLEPGAWDLVRHEAFEGGVVIHHYARAARREA